MSSVRHKYETKRIHSTQDKLVSDYLMAMEDRGFELHSIHVNPKGDLVIIFRKPIQE